MPKVLTLEQIEQYRERGYVSPVDVMSEDEAIGYKNKLEDAERAYPDQIHAKNRNNAHLTFAFLDELVHHPVIVDAVEDLIGSDFALWGTVLFIKEAHSAGYVSWHQDGTYMGMNHNDFVTPWLALTPSNPENGCMTMIPGSHREHILPHDDTFHEDNILTRGQVVSKVDPSTGVNLILKPGQMSLHHGEIIHGSQPNKSNERRIGFAMQGFMAPHIHQVVADDVWLPIRGNNDRPGGTFLTRPRFDMDPDGVACRTAANANFAASLYHGAARRRQY